MQLPPQLTVPPQLHVYSLVEAKPDEVERLFDGDILLRRRHFFTAGTGALALKQLSSPLSTL